MTTMLVIHKMRVTIATRTAMVMFHIISKLYINIVNPTKRNSIPSANEKNKSLNKIGYFLKRFIPKRTKII